MCEYCEDVTLDIEDDECLEELAYQIEFDEVPDDVLCCDVGWWMICTARGKKGTTRSAWKEICQKRGKLKFAGF
ncbi:MAG: hypothetical protein JXR18_11330 [Neptuniibacter sp.]